MGWVGAGKVDGELLSPRWRSQIAPRNPAWRMTTTPSEGRMYLILGNMEAAESRVIRTRQAKTPR